MNKTLSKTTFAAGCFWGVEAYFKLVKGVVSTKVGYTGGAKENPTYKEVCTGKTGHAEAVEITFDPSVVTFDKLLDHFWNMHDPRSLNKQGGDVGTQYRSAIFFHDKEQESVAYNSKEKLEGMIVTQILPAKTFWDAEEYHQDYLTKNPGGYCHVDLSKVNP